MKRKTKLSQTYNKIKNEQLRKDESEKRTIFIPHCLLLIAWSDNTGVSLNETIPLNIKILKEFQTI